MCKLAAIIHSEKRGGVCSLARNSWVTTLQEQHTSTFSPGLKLYRLSRFLVEFLLNNVSFYQFQEKWEQSFAKFKNAFKIETNSRAYIILGGNFKSFRLFLRHLEPPKNKIYGTSWYKYLFFWKKERKTVKLLDITFMCTINILGIAFYFKDPQRHPYLFFWWFHFFVCFSNQTAIITLWLFWE